METKFVLIGVGGTGVNAVDMMDIPNSRKVFIDRDGLDLMNVKSEGEKIHLEPVMWPSKHNSPQLCREQALYYKEEIRRTLIEAFTEE